MYLGEVVEEGSVEEVLSNPAHPYTQGLLKSMPRQAKNRRTAWSIKEAYPMLTACRDVLSTPDAGLLDPTYATNKNRQLCGYRITTGFVSSNRRTKVKGGMPMSSSTLLEACSLRNISPSRKVPS